MNGVSERSMRTISETARTLLTEANLGVEFWAEATATAVYLRNRSPHSALGGKKPYEVWYETIPEIEHLKPFGCAAYAFENHRQGKFSSKTDKCILVGYAPHTTKIWKVWSIRRRV